ncbi:hypothetical protein PFDSM3638_04030 [Pyrococcus furiosus DSM 3638]|uniref:Uncharacterized protein n=2 Tax=Pyrococcus furiosus (strain ATCC 43587 / DSM 3638 / JCM 8422 / Vc1) TaxID=186497 RepID=A0A5C0XPT1_PYRFU|nr:hypothetical protein [Pyrococcus furiosus]AAL80935.1 hypothetical protein PF0811 [Pyrococcus furiosus DSM 3638]QEK78485.1 hypothetical protein PFDSM3638_04030 [Pyrococcus furiosus DSM 3638]
MYLRTISRFPVWLIQKPLITPYTGTGETFSTSLPSKPRISYSNTDTYLYINLDYQYAIFMNAEAFNTTLTKLFINASGPYELVYSDGGLTKILKLKHPNVRIERSGDKIIFRFDNATGTKLKIWGFLDNATMVFDLSSQKMWRGRL